LEPDDELALFAWSFPPTLFIPEIPAGIFMGKVLGDKAETGAPRDDALIPSFILGSYFGVGGNFVLDDNSFVAIGLSGSGMSDDLVVVNPSRM
jgi:hypothetical protein